MNVYREITGGSTQLVKTNHYHVVQLDIEEEVGSTGYLIGSHIYVILSPDWSKCQPIRLENDTYYISEPEVDCM